MKRPDLISRSGSLVCPFCEMDELVVSARNNGRCPSCGRITSRFVVETLRQMMMLPESIGAHACECGHPEMRRLPDGVFHCPACGSEILPSVPGTQRAAENQTPYSIMEQHGRRSR